MMYIFTKQSQVYVLFMQDGTLYAKYIIGLCYHNDASFLSY